MIHLILYGNPGSLNSPSTMWIPRSSLMKFFTILLCLSTVLAASNFNSFASSVLEKASEIFYGGVNTKIYDSDDLISLATFPDDLVAVVESAIKDEPAMSSFELTTVVLEYLKQRLQDIEQWDTTSGKYIYDKYVNEFSRVYGASFHSTSSHVDAQNSLTEVLGFDLDEHLSAITQDFNVYNNEMEDALGTFFDVPSKDKDEQSTDATVNFSGSKRSNEKELNEKKWNMVVAKLADLPAKIFEFAQKIEDADLSNAYIGATVIYDNLVKKFNSYALESHKYEEGIVTENLKAEINSFFDSLRGGNSDPDTEDMFSIDLLDIADQIVKEVEQNFNEVVAQEEEHSHDLKRAKSERSSPSSAQVPFEYEIPTAPVSSNGFMKPEDANILVAELDELHYPQNVQMFDNPIERISTAFVKQDDEEFNDVRGLYWALIERDFPSLALNEEVQEFVLGSVDNSIIKAYRS